MGKIAPQHFMKRLPIPGLPEGTHLENYEGWAAGMVRTGIAAIAQIT